MNSLFEPPYGKGNCDWVRKGLKEGNLLSEMHDSNAHIIDIELRVNVNVT